MANLGIVGFSARLSFTLSIALLAAVAATPARATDGPDPEEINSNAPPSLRSFEIYGFAETVRIDNKLITSMQ